MSFEEGFSIGREIHRVINNNEAELILEYHEKDRPDAENFIEIYGEKAVKDDMDDLARRKESFESEITYLSNEERRRIMEGKERSEALEATIVGLAEFGWFGSETQTIRTHEHDDVFQGIDAVLEIPRQKKDRKIEGPKRLALALDASTDQRTEVLQEKIIRNTKKVFGNYRWPPKLKYFESKIQKVKDKEGRKTPYRGTLDFIVPVVVGLESHHANGLMSLYVRFLKLNQVENKNPEQKKDLSSVRAEILKHPAQAIFLKQITDQLDMYLNLTESADKKLPTEVVEQINELRRTFAGFSIEKINDGIEIGKLATDPVYKEIEKISKELTPEKIGLTTITTSP